MQRATFARKRLANAGIAALITSEVQWIIVLGCRARWENGTLHGALGRRVAHAAGIFHELERASSPAQIVATGGVLWDGERECMAMERALLSLSVPRRRILTEPHARTTRENATYTASLLKPYLEADDKVLLVTSDWHSRRALTLFRASALPVVAAPASDDASYPQRFFWHAREGLALVKDRVLLSVDRRLSASQASP